MARRSLPGLGEGALCARIRSPSANDVRAIGGALAATAVGFLLLTRIALNASLGQNPVGSQVAYTVANVVAVVVPAVVTITVGVVADDLALVGLVAAGSFALLAAVVPASTIAATGVIPVAALMVLASALVDDERGRIRRLLFAMLLTVGIVFSLGASSGLLEPSVRSIGTTVALLALVVAPIAIGAAPRALLVGVLAAITISAGITVAPFVAGAAFLAVGAAVDPSFVVAAAGVGGGVAVVTEGLRQQCTPVIAAGVLLLGAGVPATVPRGLAVILGAHLLLTTSSGTPVTGDWTSMTPTGGEPT